MRILMRFSPLPVLLASVAPVHAFDCPGGNSTSAPKELPRPQDGYYETVNRVEEGIWLISQPAFQVQPTGNITVIEQSDGLVLVDAGGSRGAARRVTGLIRQISTKPVKAIVLTHWHGDHVQGLSEILETWPEARTISTRVTQAHLSNPATMNSPASFEATRNEKLLAGIDGLSEYVAVTKLKATSEEEKCAWDEVARLLNQYRLDMDGTLTVSTAEGFSDRVELPDLLRPVTAMFLSRANTDGDAVVWLPNQRIVATGDIVVAPFPYGTNSYPSDWLVALRKLRALGFRLLIPGHGSVQHNTTYIDRLTDALLDARREASALTKQNSESRSAAEDKLMSGTASGFVGEDAWKRRWLREFWAKPILDAAIREARGQPIVQSLGSNE